MDATSGSGRPSRGMNGLVLLVLCVAGGMGIGSVYFRWKAPAVLAQRERELAAAPTEGDARVERWMDYGRTYIHQRLVQLRVSAATPWLVTHAVLAADADQPPTLWGVDLTDLAPEWAQPEGMQVVVRLPAARILGRAWLPEDKADFVPKVAAGEPGPEPAESGARARLVVEHALDPLRQSLPRDIPGAELVVRVEGTARSEESPR